MKDKDKTKEQLINELEEIHQRVAALEASEVKHKRAEHLIRTQAEVTKNMAEGACIVGLYDVIIRWASPKFEDMFGYELGEMIGRQASIINTPADLTPMKRANDIMEVIRRTGEWHGEVHNIKKDGASLWCYVSVSTFTHPEYGEVLLAVHTDITERKQAEEVLRRYETIVSSSTDMLALLDKRYTYLAANNAYIEAFKLTSEQLIGNTVIQVFGEERFNTTIKPHADRCMDRKEVNFQDWFSFPAYEQRYMDITYYPYYSKNNKIMGFVVNGRNITERKLAEDALKESEERYHTLFNSGNDAVLVYNLTLDNQPDKLIKVNDVTCEMLGYSREELLKLSPDDIVISNKAKITAVEAMKILLTEKRLLTESVFLGKNGIEIPVEVNIHLFTFRGQPTVMTIARDITERKEAEQKLQKAYEKEATARQKLEEQSRQRIEFTRALVHEIKTPLSSVMAASELLINECSEEPEHTLAKNIYGGTNSLNDRVNELLDLTRGEIGILTLRYNTINPGPLLNQVIAEVDPRVSVKKQFLKYDIPNSLPIIQADGVRVKQVMLNILDNAIKFTPEGGVITVKASVEDKSLVIDIEDNGPGISPKDQQRIFNAYYCADCDRERFSGLGLGMALSKVLVELHGGKIQVKSKKGKGSVFSFSLPL